MKSHFTFLMGAPCLVSTNLMVQLYMQPGKSVCACARALVCDLVYALSTTVARRLPHL